MSKKTPQQEKTKTVNKITKEEYEKAQKEGRITKY